MKADLTTVFRRWFEVAATPIDMAANAVEQYTQNHIQPVVDKAAKNLQKQTKTINAAYPGLLHSLAEDANEFKNKIHINILFSFNRWYFILFIYFKTS